MSMTPFVVGQWVRGDKFYGRTALIEEVLRGHRNWLWLLGTRRIGKTSMLKQLEYLTQTTPELGFVPVYWDFQGSTTPEELHMGFSDSLLDAEERLEEIGIDPQEIESDDLFRSISRLRRKLRSKKLKLLLLCDEVEELIQLHQKNPALLGKLRRALQSHDDVRSVMASTIRLWKLSEQRGDTSPFLHGFLPPLYIHNLSDEHARSLINQANLPHESRPRFDGDLVERIRSYCDNHPYLIQLLCKRHAEAGNFEEAVEHVAVDPMVGFFFSVDFEMLSALEHRILRTIAEHDSSTSNSIQDQLTLESSQLTGCLQQLEHLGYIRRSAEGRFVLANYFFRRWFRDLPIEDDATQGDATTAVQVKRHSTTTEALELGAFDGRYQLLERVGSGATGVVYRAQDTLLETTIAIKVLKPEYAEHEEALERLRREIILSRDIAHPNIVRIYHLGQFEGNRYLTMQWIGGPTLGAVIQEQAPMKPTRAVSIATCLAGALEAAHALHVLHRDIKPHNILMGDDDAPHVTDFGLARLIHSPGMTRSGVFVGTPDYCSPEQAGLDKLDERSDLYALGLVLFEMLTGQRPFKGNSTQEVLELHRSAPAPAPRDLQPNVPHELSGLVLRCLEKNPSNRFQTAHTLRVVLENLDLPS